jgi:hypothetical protein
MWVEGNDPECTDSIFGGYAKFSMTSRRARARIPGHLQGRYRTEYDDYMEEYGSALPDAKRPRHSIMETTAGAPRENEEGLKRPAPRRCEKIFGSLAPLGMTKTCRSERLLSFERLLSSERYCHSSAAKIF